MARIVSFPAPPGYQRRWEWPGKRGNRALQTPTATRSVKAARAREAELAIEERPNGGRIARSGPTRYPECLGIVRTERL